MFIWMALGLAKEDVGRTICYDTKHYLSTSLPIQCSLYLCINKYYTKEIELIYNFSEFNYLLQFSKKVIDTAAKILFVRK